MLTSFLNIYAALALGSPDIISDTNHDKMIRAPEAYEAYEQALPASAVPLKKDFAIQPVIEAESAIIVDFDSGSVLFSKNSNQKMSIASITKLMTAIVALEEGNLNDTVTISKNASLTEGSKIWLYSGERITLENLLFAALIHSGNDAAVAIAEHVAGDVETFVEKMNIKAKNLGLISTRFENPIGFDHIDNYSTVNDLAILANYAYNKPFVKKAVRINSMTISSANGDITHDLETTNKLLDSFLDILGLKTGHTRDAGLCFTSIIQNEKGNKIITVVLNSPDRFTETKKMAAWTFNSYIW